MFWRFRIDQGEIWELIGTGYFGDWPNISFEWILPLESSSMCFKFGLRDWEFVHTRLRVG